MSVGICHHCRRGIETCVAEPCPPRVDLNAEDARDEAYCAGYNAHRNKKPRPADVDGAAGWDARESDVRTVCVPVERREGYYHCDPRGEI